MVGLPESILSSYIKGVPWIRKFPQLTRPDWSVFKQRGRREEGLFG
jgi:hypothetical protein